MKKTKVVHCIQDENSDSEDGSQSNLEKEYSWRRSLTKKATQPKSEVPIGRKRMKRKAKVDCLETFRLIKEFHQQPVKKDIKSDKTQISGSESAWNSHSIAFEVRSVAEEVSDSDEAIKILRKGNKITFSPFSNFMQI